MDFYFNKDMPIIREITQSKTTDYLEKILKNDNSFKSIHNHILDLKRYQLDVRLDLYNIYNNMFDALLH